jgi:hypothetical protein
VPPGGHDLALAARSAVAGAPPGGAKHSGNLEHRDPQEVMAMKYSIMTALAFLGLAASGCASSGVAHPPVARECSAPGAYVVSPPTSQHGFLTGSGSNDPRVQSVDTVELQGRGVPQNLTDGVPVRTAADTAAGRGDTVLCF